MTSVAQEIVDIHEILNKYVEIEKHGGPEGAAITWAMNRLGRLAADAEYRLKAGKAPQAEAPPAPEPSKLSWEDAEACPLPAAPGEDDCEACQ